jgi:hypothetical protein
MEATAVWTYLSLPMACIINQGDLVTVKNLGVQQLQHYICPHLDTWEVRQPEASKEQKLLSFPAIQRNTSQPPRNSLVFITYNLYS